jgi:hypothetical protein
LLGVVYEEIFNGPASLLAPLVKKCVKTMKENEADITKKTAKLLEKQYIAIVAWFGGFSQLTRFLIQRDRRLFGRALEDYLSQQKMTEPGLTMYTLFF